MPVITSPLHDRDSNELDEEQKKPHYHHIIAFEGPTTFNNVQKLIAPLNGPIPKKCHHVKGSIQYLTHKNNPEKVQYDEKDILLFGGFNPTNYEDVMSRKEIDTIKMELVTVINDYGFREYKQLIDLTLTSERVDWFSVASNNTIFFQGYLGSCRHGELMGDDRNPDEKE